MGIYVELNTGETVQFSKETSLLAIGEGWVEARVDGEEATVDIGCLKEVGGLLISAEVNTFCGGFNAYSDAHLSIRTDARLFLHQASQSLLPRQRYAFPISGENYEYSPKQWLTKVVYGYHMGTDIYCADGTEVVTLSRGRVVAIREYRSGVDPEDYWGKAVCVVGDDRFLYYFHFQRIEVSVGQEVEKGERIGTVGRVSRPKTSPPISTSRCGNHDTMRSLKKSVPSERTFHSCIPAWPTDLW